MEEPLLILRPPSASPLKGSKLEGEEGVDSLLLLPSPPPKGPKPLGQGVENLSAAAFPGLGRAEVMKMLDSPAVVGGMGWGGGLKKQATSGGLAPSRQRTAVKFDGPDDEPEPAPAAETGVQQPQR